MYQDIKRVHESFKIVVIPLLKVFTSLRAQMANHRREDDDSGGSSGSSGCLLVPQKWTSTLYKVDEVAERPPWPPIWLIRDTPTTPICSD